MEKITGECKKLRVALAHFWGGGYLGINKIIEERRQKIIYPWGVPRVTPAIPRVYPIYPG